MDVARRPRALRERRHPGAGSVLPGAPSHVRLQRRLNVLVHDGPKIVLEKLARELVAARNPFLRVVLRDEVRGGFVMLRTTVSDDDEVVATALVPGNSLRDLCELPRLGREEKDYLKAGGWSSPSQNASQWWCADLEGTTGSEAVEAIAFGDSVALWDGEGSFEHVSFELWDCVDVVRYGARHHGQGGFMPALWYGYGFLELLGVDPDALPAAGQPVV